MIYWSLITASENGLGTGSKLMIGETIKEAASFILVCYVMNSSANSIYI